MLNKKRITVQVVVMLLFSLFFIFISGVLIRSMIDFSYREKIPLQTLLLEKLSETETWTTGRSRRKEIITTARIQHEGLSQVVTIEGLNENSGILVRSGENEVIYKAYGSYWGEMMKKSIGLLLAVFLVVVLVHNSARGIKELRKRSEPTRQT